MEQNAATQASHEPTSTNPLAFFYYFFVKSGFQSFRGDFFSFEDNVFCNIVDWNREEEYIVCRGFNYEKEEEFTYTIQFSEELKELLVREYNRAVEKIEARALELTEESQIIYYLKQLIQSIEHLLKRLVKSPIASKYEQNRNALKAIRAFIFERFAHFTKELIAEANESLILQEMPSQPPKRLPAPEQQTISFKWTANPLERSQKLYEGLMEHGFISRDVEFGTFRKAFEGAVLNEPLNIKWIKTYKGKLSKAMIFHLIFELETQNLIENNEHNSKIFSTIAKIFIDFKGRKLENLPQSYKGYFDRKSDLTTPESKLLEIIKSLS